MFKVRCWWQQLQAQENTVLFPCDSCSIVLWGRGGAKGGHGHLMRIFGHPKLQQSFGVVISTQTVHFSKM